MLSDSDKLHLMFEILEELSSAKGHRDHYKALYDETRKAMVIRYRQLQTAMRLLAEREFDFGVMGVCGVCGYRPHHESCELDALVKDIEYAKEHGVSGYDLDGNPVT